tara:strand:- start:296 stop:640 length:345 start_codon:yes stop_codon:yes gene_type:complete
MLEYQLQIKVIEYLKSKKLSKLRFFHVPNQGIRNIKYNYILKKMGMKSGCPDLILEFKNGRIVYIELKSKKGTLSSNQKIWLNVSKTLKTPHFILKGSFLDVQKKLNEIITKFY